MKTILKYWSPALLWIIVINLMSIDLFSGAHTGEVLFQVLAWLGVAPSHWGAVNLAVRKAAHVTEYGILSGTLFWSLRRTTLPAVRRAWDFRWARTAWLVCAVVAVIDELHQMLVPSRTPAVHDVVIDCAGAAAVQLALWLMLRDRPRPPAAEPGPSATPSQAASSV